MSIKPGHKQYISGAHIATAHKQPAADDGYVGIAWKNKTPDGKTVAPANRGVIPQTEPYLMLLHGEHNILANGPQGDISAVAVGDLVYITTATNALSLASGAGKKVLGKCSALAGTLAVPTGKVRVNLNEKVA